MSQFINSILSIILILVFISYNINILYTLPCYTTIADIFISQFVHIEVWHLFSNLFSLYLLSILETKLGLQKYLFLIILLLTLNTMLEFILHSFLNIKCSIGFSGVILGLFTYYIIYTNNHTLSLWQLLFIIYTGIQPSLIQNNISISGHLIGILSGLIVGFFYH